MTRMAIMCSLFWMGSSALAAPSRADDSYRTKARDVTDFIQAKFWQAEDGRYFESLERQDPAYMWTNGIMLSALVGAVRHEPKRYEPTMNQFFAGLDAYWDVKAKNPGYEPTPDRPDIDDKYYDDNAWMVLAFLEAYQATGDDQFLLRAEETLKFVLSGLDQQAGGGIWWHEQHDDGTKNTCVSAPAAVASLNLARFNKIGVEDRELVETAKELVEWTILKLQAPDGLFHDRIVVATGEVKKGKLTYNSALMIRALLGLYRVTQMQRYLDEAQRVARAADWFIDDDHDAYRNDVKWSHLMLEADLELYRATGDERLLRRAKSSADYFYRNWKANHPNDLISNASVARALWLMADLESSNSRAFWKKSDATK